MNVVHKLHRTGSNDSNAKLDLGLLLIINNISWLYWQHVVAAMSLHNTKINPIIKYRAFKRITQYDVNTVTCLTSCLNIGLQHKYWLKTSSAIYQQNRPNNYLSDRLGVLEALRASCRSSQKRHNIQTQPLSVIIHSSLSPDIQFCQKFEKAMDCC